MSKVFIGFDNVASQIGDIKAALKDYHGIDCITAIKESGSRIISNNVIDYDVAKLKSYAPLFKPRRISYPVKTWWEKRVDDKIWNRAIKECSTFIFFVNSFNQDHSDYDILKQKGKKIIQVFVGDDARWYNAMKQEFSIYGMRPIEYDDSPYNLTFDFLRRTLRRVRMAEIYADAVFSRLDQAQIELKPFHRWNMMVRPEIFLNNPKQRQKPLIVHAPSSSAFKGTKYILESVEKLKKEIDFDFKLIQNVPYKKAMAIYNDCDIVIDQVLCPGSGKLSTEALASGKIVLSLMNYDRYPQNNPKDCPIIDVNADTLKEKLKELINDHDFRKAHALKGRPYVEERLDVKFFAEKVKKIMNGEPVNTDYAPSFFREKYKPADGSEADLFNEWNGRVKKESWYKEYVPEGERDGIKF